jgi:hypothetical protein
LDDVVAEQVRNEVLAEDPNRTPFHCLGRMLVPVADVTRDTAEEISRYHSATVVRDAADIDSREVADGLEDRYVVEEEIHRHCSHDRSDSVACLGQVRVPPAMLV